PIYLVVLLSFLPPIFILADHWDRLVDSTPDTFIRGLQVHYYYRDAWHEFGRAMNVWVRIASGLVGTLLLLAVAARAAGSVSGERAGQTFDEILASPLTNEEIVSAKWYGSLFGFRRGWVWLGLIYFVGLVSGGVNLLGAILALGAWFCFAAFMASLGLWFSV